MSRSVTATRRRAARDRRPRADRTGQLDRDTGFAAEQTEIGALIGSPNQVEAVTATFEKRPPVFSDPA